MVKKFSIFVIFILIFTFLYGWKDCPMRETNCPFPGKCGLYVDTDNDSICDHSQYSPGNRVKASNKDTVIKDLSPQKLNENPVSGNEPKTKVKRRIYHLIPISVILTLLYILTSILSKRKIIRFGTHIKIWNVLLLISFLISGILGILLIIRVNSGLTIALPFNILFWHVEFGIAMAIISIFHIIWHWKYFFHK